MEEEGIFYFFEHSAGKHTLVLGNNPGVHQPVPNQAQAKYGYLYGGNQPGDIVTRWHIEQEFQPGKTTITDYYFETPSNNLGDGEGAYYDNTFTCVPFAVPFRPARVTPRPVVYGSQTAVVVGLAGEEIDTDKYGRIKVQFHWDREGKKDQNSSCWTRVAT